MKFPDTRGGAVLLLLTVLLSMFGSSCNNTASNRVLKDIYELTPQEINLLQDGDIILRHGYGFVSNTIVKTLAEDISVSHAGIIVKDKRGQWQVIHSVSQSLSDYDGVQTVPLNNFIRDSQPGSVIVVRFRDEPERSELLPSVSGKAWDYLQQQIPFDYSFDLEDSTRFFCTEFIARVISEVYDESLYYALYPPHLSALDKLKFGVFLDPRWFKVILNHQETDKP